MTQANSSFKRPLLTIAIPTWNRSKELQECIQLIAAEIDAVSEGVEIFVSDNASSDGTEELLCQMEKRFCFLRHSRNVSNVGADRNFLEAFKRSSGEYVWLFSDDDFMAKGAVKEILRIIRAHEPCYITTNYLWCDQEKRINRRQPQKRAMVSRDLTNADINMVFSRRNHWLSFMSCNIYRRDLLDIAKYQQNLGSVKNWVQVYIAAHISSKKQCAYLSSYYAVYARTGNNQRWNISDIFVKGMPDAFNVIFDEFKVDKDVRIQVMNGIRKTFLPLTSFIMFSSVNTEISQSLVPYYYKLVLRIPKSQSLLSMVSKIKLNLVHWIKRFLAGKGFSLLPERLK